MLLAAGTAHAELRVVRVLPDVVYAEQDPRGWRLNFDVILENTGPAPVVISYLELEAFDADGRLVTRVHMGGGGLPPAVEMVPRRVIPVGERLHVFNPFETLPADLEFESVRLGIHHAGGRVTVPVRPVKDVPFVLPVLPFGGELFVESGADLRSAHRRVSLTDPRQQILGRERVSERHALDLTRIDRVGAYRDGDRTDPDSWFAWDVEVRSPAMGTVVSVRDGVADNRLLATGGVERGERDLDDAAFLLGNHVVLDIGRGVHMVVAHLREGSIDVQPGDAVWEGALLGRIGLSGQTSYPHLHIQLQRGPDVLDAVPVPLVFACVRDIGGNIRRPAWLTTGDRVRACEIGQDGRRLRENG
jgi:hypothetical protein